MVRGNEGYMSIFCFLIGHLWTPLPGHQTPYVKPEPPVYSFIIVRPNEALKEVDGPFSFAWGYARICKPLASTLTRCG